MRRKAKRTQICHNFFAHVDQSGGPDACWPFLRSKSAKGYGRVWANGRCEEAHRYAYTLAIGPIPDSINGKMACILHSCDFPPCCNPKHLRVGTKFENAIDREVRGRGNQPKGENNYASELTTRQVIFIRRCADIFNTEEMAAMLNVKRACVAKVLRRETWKHVVEHEPQAALRSA